MAFALLAVNDHILRFCEGLKRDFASYAKTSVMLE